MNHNNIDFFLSKKYYIKTNINKATFGNILAAYITLFIIEKKLLHFALIINFL